MFLVPPSIQAARLKICKECKFSKQTPLIGLTCGTFVTGDTVTDTNRVTHYRKKIQLCGCKMSWKTKYKTASCPAGRWDMYKLTKEEGKELKAYVSTLEDMVHFSYEELKRLSRWAFKISGDAKDLQISQCPSCVREMVTNLRKLAEHL